MSASSSTTATWVALMSPVCHRAVRPPAGTHRASPLPPSAMDKFGVACRLPAWAVALCLLAAPLPAAAERTVCTITVNSSDEKEAFRRHLPEPGHRFVELVER